MPKMVTLTIDGTEVKVPKGTTILEAAKQVGKVIPHYCYHPGMSVSYTHLTLPTTPYV